MTNLFTSNKLHLLKELEIDAIIHSKDWIFGAAVDSGFKILYKPFWWTEGYNYGQKWTYQYDVNELHFDPNGLIGLIGPEANDIWINFADPAIDDEGYMMDNLKVYWQQDRNTSLWLGTNPNENIYKYKANFYLKVGDNTGGLSVATLYVERGDNPHPDENTNWTILDSLILFPNDFQTTNYEIFTLNFDHSDLTPIPSIVRDLYEDQNLELRNSNAPDHCMNYRIYWHNNVALSSWKVEVIDHFAESVINGDIDVRIDSLLTAPSAIHVPYYYRDEPESDQLFVEKYITDKIEAVGKNQYTNLYPIYARYFQYDMDFLRDYDDGYPDYLEQVSKILNPKYSGADHYPEFYLGDHQYRVHRFLNELKLMANIPTQKLFYQIPTGPNKSWINIYSFLPIAFGAKGIIIYNWWRIINGSQQTERYSNTQNVTKYIRTIEDHLISLNRIETFTPPLNFSANSIVNSVTNDSLAIGEFLHPESNEKYLFIVNLKIEPADIEEFDVTLNLLNSKSLIEDVALSRIPWDGDENRVAYQVINTSNPTFQVKLNPGEGRLFRITSGLYGDFTKNLYISGSTRIIDDVTIQPSAKMTIYSGAVVDFGPYYGTSLQIFGELEANGTQENPIEINVENTGPWNEILIDNASVQMNYVNITNVQSMTIRNSSGQFTNCNFVLDQGLLLEGGTSYLTNCSFKATDINGAAVATITTPISDRYIALFDRCEFYDSDKGLLTGYNSIVELFNCNIHSNHTGIYSFGSSEPWLHLTGSNYDCNTTNNKIIDNNTGIIIIQDALPFLGFELPFGGFNRFDNLSSDLIDFNFGPYPIYALVNHWSSGVGCSPSNPNNLYGDILYSPTVNDLFGNNEDQDIIHYQALLAEAEKNYSLAIQLYDQIITDNYEDSLAVLWSLAGINRSYQKMDNVEELKSYTSSKAALYADTPIEKYSKNYNITAHVLLEDYMQAESKIMEFEQDYPDFEMMDKIEFEKALIAEYKGNNSSGRLQSNNLDIVTQYSLSEKAKKRYQSVVEKYSDTGYGILARMKLAGELDIEDEKIIPSQYELLSVYPNPFNPSTTIQFELQESGHVSLIVYNILGQQVKKLSEVFMQKGTHSVQWNGKNDQGQSLPSGMYLIQYYSDYYSINQKIVLLK